MFAKKNVLVLIVLAALLAVSAAPSFALPRSCDEQCGCNASCSYLCTLYGTIVVTCGQLYDCQDYCGSLTGSDDLSLSDVFGYDTLLLGEASCGTSPAETPADVQGSDGAGEPSAETDSIQD